MRLPADLPAALGDLAGLPVLASELLNQCPIQMLIIDRDMRIRWTNTVFSRTRDSAVQIVGRPAAEFFGDLDAHAPRFTRAFSGEPTHLLMSTQAPADGVAYDLNVFLRPIHDHAGNVPALCVFIGDLGFQRIGEESLPGTAQAMRQVIGSLPDLVLILDRELHVLFANRAVGRRTVEQVEGLHVTELLPEPLHPVALATLHRVLANGQVDSYGSEIEGADGQTRHFDVRVSAIRREQRIVGLTLNATEITEQIRAERAILQAVNREQYRIGNDLHDGLGQELTGIALMLRGLAGRVTGEYPPIQPEIESITRLVSNAIESTRALARGLSPVNLERGGLQDALEGLAMHASELYGVPTVFTHRVPANRPLNAELANHLYRIAQEAVRNAVRHGHARSIRLHLSAARAKVRLAITDDGVGMPPGAMDAIGMGLKIMCYRARILGGEVSFEPADPTGTRVVCECPVQAAGGNAPVRRAPKRRVRTPQ